MSGDSARPIVSAVARFLPLLVCYAGLAVALTWPLAAHLDTHFGLPWVLAHFDTLRLTWALAWETHALATDPSMLLDANIYHPTPSALAYGQMAFGMLLYFAPVELATGNPVLALNVAWLASVALSCASLHFVVRAFTGSDAAGFVGAATLVGTRWMLWDYGGFAQNYAVVQYLPWILFLLARSPPSPRGRVLLFALVALQSLSDVYLAASVLGVLALQAGAWALSEATRTQSRRLAEVVAGASLVAAIAYLPHALVAWSNDGLADQTLWGSPGVLDAAWIFSRLRGPIALPPAMLALIGVGAVLHWRRARAGAGSAASRAGWRRAGFFAVAGLAIASAQLHEILAPGGVPVRGWVRLGTTAWVALATLAGLAFAEVAASLAARGVPRRAAAAALCVACAAAVFADFAYSVGRPAFLATASRAVLPAAYPLKAAIEPSEEIVRILRESGRPVLEIGALQDGVGAFGNARAMYRSIFHWSPLVNGYGSYYPGEFPERMALATRLPDRDALSQLRAVTGLAWVLVSIDQLTRVEAPRWRALAARGGGEGLELVVEERDRLLFRATGCDPGLDAETCPPTPDASAVR